MDRISVGSKFVSWWFILPLVCAVLAAGGGVALHASAAEGLAALLIVAAPFALWAGIAGVYIALTRRWIEISPGASFAIHDRHGRRDFRDSDVEEIRLLRQQNYSAGLLKSVTRRLRLGVRLAGQLIQLRMRHLVKIQRPDPLGDWLNRIHEDLHGRLERRLTAGDTIAGDGVRLDRAGVSAGGRQARYDELAAVEVFDGNVCVWLTGQEEPWLRLAVSSLNAPLLGRLIGARIRTDEDEARAVGGLGRVLFERRAPLSSVIVIGVIGGLALLFGGTFAVIGQGEARFGVPGVSLLVALLLGLAAWHRRRAAFRCHEQGVCKRSLLGDRTLRYEDVGSLSYSATRHFVNGAYTGTVFSFGFAPRPGSGGRPIRYSTTIQGADSEMEDLREHIARVIARRMEAELAAGKDVPWTTKLRFLPDAIEYLPTGIFGGRKDPLRIPYREIHGWNMQEGVFYLWQKGQQKPIVSEPVAQTNFFPGYALLERMCGSPQ